MTSEQFKLKVFSIKSLNDFNEVSLEIFSFQYKNNAVYRSFVEGVCHDVKGIKHYLQIPCLPVEFYKTHKIASVEMEPELTFRSSGTTGQVRSNNYVFSKEVYKESIMKSFTQFFGKPSDYIICALTPDFESHRDSSLAFMLDYLIAESSHPESGFYYGNEEKLVKVLSENAGAKKMLFGITYALIQFAAAYSCPLQNTTIIETGGMKGKMKEITREEVHSILKKSFACPVESEYSMAELMSQAYTTDGHKFSAPPWMKILIREVNDPLAQAPEGKTGGINIIDLANYHSCSFISTKDLGILHPGDSFEVLGRFDNSDIRGCNLLAYEI